MTLRPLIASDKNQWLVLWAGYLHFCETKLSDEITQTTWQRLLSDTGHQGIGYFNDQGKMLGFVHYLFHDSTWSANGYCYLEDLFVSEAARAQGAGKALIESVYEEAQKAGITRVYWHTNEGNKTARNLYDKVATLSDFIQYRIEK